MGHTVLIEPYAGVDGRGKPFYAAPFTSVAHVIHKRQLVRTGAGVGDTALSSTTVLVPTGTTAPVQSRITLPDDTRSIVLARAVHEWPGFDVPDHVELSLA